MENAEAELNTRKCAEGQKKNRKKVRRKSALSLTEANQGIKTFVAGDVSFPLLRVPKRSSVF